MKTIRTPASNTPKVHAAMLVICLLSSTTGGFAQPHTSNGNGLGPTDFGTWYCPLYDKIMWERGGWGGGRGIRHRPLCTRTLNYVGNWVHVTGQGDYYNNDYHSTEVAGDYVEYTFYSVGTPPTTCTQHGVRTGIRVIGSKGPNTGQIEVQLDGVTVGIYSTYSATWSNDEILFEQLGFASGKHTIKVTAVDDAQIVIDAFEDRNIYYAFNNESYFCNSPDSYTHWTRVNDDDPGFRQYDSSEVAIMDLHIQQLAAAKVDFVLFDITNGGLGYPTQWPNLMGGWPGETPAFFRTNVEEFCKRLKVWNDNHSWKIKYAIACGTWYSSSVATLESLAKDVYTNFFNNALYGGPNNYYQLGVNGVNGGALKPLLVVHDGGNAAVAIINSANADPNPNVAKLFQLKPSGALVQGGAQPYYGHWPDSAPVYNTTAEETFLSPGFNNHGTLPVRVRNYGSFYDNAWQTILGWPSQQKQIPKIILLGSFVEYIEANAVWSADTRDLETVWTFGNQVGDERWEDTPGHLNPHMYWDMTIKYANTLKKSRVAWWPGENNTTDVVGAQNGVLEGGATYASGKIGSAFSLNGSGQDVLVADSPYLDVSGGMTLEAWVKPTRSGYWQNVITKWDAAYQNPEQKSYVLGLYPDNRIYVGVSRNGHDYDVGGTYGARSVLSTTALPINGWSHVVGTYNGQTLVIYVNGRAEGSISYPTVGDIFQGTDPLSIGAVRGGGGFASAFQGSIDEPGVYKRALSSGEVLLNFKSGLGGLVASWPAEDSACDVADSKSDMLEGGVGFASGKVGRAFSFNGVDQAVRVRDRASLDLTTAMTLEAWVKPSRNGYYQNIISKWDGCLQSPEQKSYILGLDPYNRPYIGFSNLGDDQSSVAAIGPNSIPTTSWSHVVGTYDGSYLKVYVNGSLQTTIACSGSIFSGTDDLTIGAVVGGCSGTMVSMFQGLIDEPSVYNRALTSGEITALYNSNGP